MADIKIRGVELTLDLLDADVVELYDSKMGTYLKDINDVPEGNSNAEEMRRQIRLTDTLLDDLFGAGTAGRIFADTKPSNLGARLGAMAELTDVVRETRKEIASYMARVDENNAYVERAEAFEQKAKPEPFPGNKKRRRKH